MECLIWVFLFLGALAAYNRFRRTDVYAAVAAVVFLIMTVVAAAWTVISTGRISPARVIIDQSKPSGRHRKVGKHRLED